MHAMCDRDREMIRAMRDRDREMTYDTSSLYDGKFFLEHDGHAWYHV